MHLCCQDMILAHQFWLILALFLFRDSFTDWQRFEMLTSFVPKSWKITKHWNGREKLYYSMKEAENLWSCQLMKLLLFSGTDRTELVLQKHVYTLLMSTEQYSTMYNKCLSKSQCTIIVYWATITKFTTHGALCTTLAFFYLTTMKGFVSFITDTCSQYVQSHHLPAEIRQ